MISRKRFARSIAFGILSVTSAYCYAEKWKVIDKDDGSPIPKAIVVATWNGVVMLPVQPLSKCYHVEATVTDERGEFEMSALSGNSNPFLMDRERHFTILAPGYKESETQQLQGAVVSVEKMTGSKSQQFKQLPGTQMLGCGGDERALLPYLKVLYVQMTLLASTREEKLDASGVLYSIETIELGKDEAMRRLGPREGKVRRETQ